MIHILGKSTQGPRHAGEMVMVDGLVDISDQGLARLGELHKGVFPFADNSIEMVAHQIHALV